MDTERGYLEVLFRRIPYQTIRLNMFNENNNAFNENNNVFDEINTCNGIKEDLFVTYATEVFSQCSLDERKQVYHKLQEEFKKHKNIFVLLAEFADKMLVFNEREPRCEYNQILRWRDISFQLGQDIFTTSFLAYKDVQVGQKTSFFAWSPIIKTNNKRLENILNKGTAENHFHLNGSTQIFTLSWICLMNHITNRSEEFGYLKKYLDTKAYYSIQDDIYGGFRKKQETLYESCMKASLYRLYLYLICCEEKSDKEVRSFLSKGRQINPNDKEEKEEFQKFVVWVEQFDELDLINLQNRIEVVKIDQGVRFGNTVLDYALDKQMIGVNDNEQKLLAGERKLMYQCFQQIFQGKFDDFGKNVFYRYLIIKTMFRSELIQVNRKSGFANFSIYQDRKEIFIEKYQEYKTQLLRLAVNATFESEEVRSLEARIAPKNSAEANSEKINDTDRIISKVEGANVVDGFLEDKDSVILGNSNPDILDKFFYVLHFIKAEDKKKESEFLPRNSNVRSIVRIQTKVIVNIMEKNAKVRERIRGIDAANSEIGCRPEVFACAFRYLLNLNVNRRYIIDEEIKAINLQGTYHVGEDFLDLADGLRAIDEVILYLNFRRGNRLGHALALGINPTDYYSCKHFTIRLPKQDMLDNVVWLIEKAKEYGISVRDGLYVMLERKFEDLFSYIYGDKLTQKNKLPVRVTTYEYFCSWKLRGDEPTLYQLSWKEFQQKVNENAMFQYDYFCINREVPDEIRRNETYYSLYYYYHFDKEVKARGLEVDELHPDEAYITLIREIQDKMIAELCDKGIAVECNPSSNYLIGTFGKYEKHPITRFNSLGLEEQKKSLSVSINTDDQGVFDTLLENEYALMALALQKKKDENGNSKYNPEEIYKYLDYVRELGFEQKF